MDMTFIDEYIKLLSNPQTTKEEVTKFILTLSMEQTIALKNVTRMLKEHSEDLSLNK